MPTYEEVDWSNNRSKYDWENWIKGIPEGKDLILVRGVGFTARVESVEASARNYGASTGHTVKVNKKLDGGKIGFKFIPKSK